MTRKAPNTLSFIERSKLMNFLQDSTDRWRNTKANWDIVIKECSAHLGKEVTEFNIENTAKMASVLLSLARRPRKHEIERKKNKKPNMDVIISDITSLYDRVGKLEDIVKDLQQQMSTMMKNLQEIADHINYGKISPVV